MKKMLVLATTAAMVLSMGAIANAEDFSAIDPAAATPVETKVALITMDQMDVHWVRLQEGAADRIAEYEDAGSKIELEWLAPEVKDNAQQIQKIEAAIADGCEYIVIACNDATAANRALEEAIDAGIKVIYIDSPATVEVEATFATDNYAGGALVGERLLEILTDAGITEGTIGIVDSVAGTQSTIDRSEGFKSVFADTDFVMGENQYSDGDAAKAQELANTLVNNGVVAIYGTNDGATQGAAAAVADANKNGMNIYMVGFDKSDTNITHVENGELLAFAAQNPGTMGAYAIDAVVKLANGEELGGIVVDTGVSLVDADNVADFK